MFSSLDANIDSIYKSFWIIATIYIILSGGFGFLFKIVTVPFKIKISDRKLHSLDNNLFDLQLLRIFHGIHVANKKDAELAFKAINEGVIYRHDFKFLTFLPPIGKEKTSKSEAFSISVLLVISIIIIFQLGEVAMEGKYNYAFFNENNNRVLISNNKIYNPIDKKYTLKSECKKNPETLPPIIKSACNYLTTEDEDMRNELAEAIQTNNNGYTVIITFIVTVSFTLLLGTALYFKYRRINNKFCDYKSKIIKQETPPSPPNALA